MAHFKFFVEWVCKHWQICDNYHVPEADGSCLRVWVWPHWLSVLHLGWWAVPNLRSSSEFNQNFSWLYNRIHQTQVPNNTTGGTASLLTIILIASSFRDILIKTDRRLVQLFNCYLKERCQCISFYSWSVVNFHFLLEYNFQICWCWCNLMFMRHQFKHLQQKINTAYPSLSNQPLQPSPRGKSRRRQCYTQVIYHLSISGLMLTSLCKWRLLMSYRTRKKSTIEQYTTCKIHKM